MHQAMCCTLARQSIKQKPPGAYDSVELGSKLANKKLKCKATEVNEEGCGVEVQGWGKGENLRRGRY